MKDHYKTLAELADDAPLVISDNIITDNSCNQWFRNAVYPAGEFGKIDVSILEQLIGVAESSLQWWKHPVVYTGIKMQEEMQYFVRKLENKQGFLVRNTRKIEQDEIESDRQKSASLRARGAQLLRKSIDLHKSIAECAGEKMVVPNGVMKLALLEDLVTYVASRTNAKQVFGNEANQKKERKEDMYVDEQLVATVLYASLIAYRPVVFVGADSNPIRMLNALHLLLQEDGVLYKREHDILFQAPIYAYFAEKNGPRLQYASTWPQDRLKVPLNMQWKVRQKSMLAYARERLSWVRDLCSHNDSIFPYGRDLKVLLRRING